MFSTSLLEQMGFLSTEQLPTVEVSRLELLASALQRQRSTN